MTNWKVYTTFGAMRACSSSGNEYHEVEVDDWIEFSNGYEKKIYVNYLPWKLYKQYIEIDTDYTKRNRKEYIFGSDVIRKVPLDVLRRREREEMIRTASVDPTALAITRQGMDRVDQNQQNEFEYKMEDNSGNKHQWIYRHKKY